MILPSPLSLRRRLLLTLVTLCALYSAILALFVVLTYEAGQESAAQRLLAAEAERYQRALASDPAAPPNTGALVRSYVGRQALPAVLRQNLHRFEAEDYDIPLEEWKEIQLWRGTTVDGEELFLVLDLGATADREILAPNLRRLLALGAAVFLGFGLWSAWFMSRRLTRPMSTLAAAVAAHEPGTTAWRDPLVGHGGADAEAQGLAHAFLAMDRRLRDVLERERQFTRNASHELRTPITAAKGSHEILHRTLSDPAPRTRRALATLGQAVADMETLVDTFLWLARAESDLEVTKVADTGAWLEQLVAQHRPLLGDRPVTVHLVVSAPTHRDLPLDLFRIAAANLVRNAFQYTREGQVTIQLETEALTVTDSGEGIPPELLDHLGEPFRKGDGSSGYGLGLTIVQRIAQRCGWRLELASEPHGGTQVRLALRAEEAGRAGGEP